MKKIVSLFGVLFLVFFLTACSNNLENTDLSNIRLDNMKIGDIISEEDLSKYNESDKYIKKTKYTFEEICIDVDDKEQINYLFARFDEYYIDININDTNNLKLIKDIENILGNNFQDKKYDSEQLLREYIYIDKVNNLKAEFIYSQNTNILRWIILRKQY